MRMIQAVKSSFSAVFLAGAQISVLVAVVASRLGERVLRGHQGFVAYREALSEQS